jgi:DNA processing protein
VDHLLPYLKIFRTPKIGPKTFYRLMQQFQNDHELILKFLKNNDYLIPSLSDIQKEIDKLYQLKGQLLFVEDEDYPLLLKNIDDAPPFLTLLGNKKVLKKNSIAIVGARNASFTTMRFVEKLSTSLAEKGYAIISGLARGVDTAAHKGSLKEGTIAILAGGVDQVYPLENKKLYQQIQEEGLILSEMPLQTVPSAQLFARRNRIISGMSHALVLAEAAIYSGSMITAQFALSQGRDVYVIPGHPADPRSEGGNKLIQQGAYLLQQEDDINISPILTEQKMKITLQKIEPSSKKNKEHNTLIDDGSLEKKILILLSNNPIPLEDLLNHFEEIDASSLISLISEMDLKGKIVLTENQMLIRQEI